MANSISLFVPAVKIFLKVCQTQSFSAAANQLGMTQPAVSMAITKLERKLEVDLLQRSRPLALTPEGVTLEKTLLELTDKTDSVIMDIKRRQRLLPMIRIGVIDSLRDTLGLEIIAKFRSIASRIHLISGTSDQLLEDLKSGLLDIVVAGDRPNTAAFSTLHKVFILEEETIIIFPKSLARSRETWSWDNIRFSGLPLIRYAHSWSNEHILEEFKAVQKWDFPTTIDIDNTHLMLALVANGEGWAITHPACLFHQAELCKEIEIITPQPSLKGRNLYVFFPRTGLVQYATIIEDLVRSAFPSTQPQKNTTET